MWDDFPIHIMLVAISLTILGVHMNISCNVGLKMIVSIKRSNILLPPPPPQLHWLLSLEWLTFFEFVVQCSLSTLLCGVFLSDPINFPDCNTITKNLEWCLYFEHIVWSFIRSHHNTCPFGACLYKPCHVPLRYKNSHKTSAWLRHACTLRVPTTNVLFEKPFPYYVCVTIQVFV